MPADADSSGQEGRNVAAQMLATLLDEHMAALVASNVTRLRAEVAEYRSIPDELLTAEVAGMMAALRGELSGAPDAVVAPTPTEYGRIRAERGIALESVLQAYRVAWINLWGNLVAATKAAGSPSVEEMLDISADFFALADVFIAWTLEGYRERDTQIAIREERERAATLDGLLTGAVRGRERLWEAAARLDLPYTGTFVVAAASARPGTAALPSAREDLRALGLGSVWRLRADMEVGIISLPGEEALPRVLGWLDQAGARVGVSIAFADLAETPHALHLARLALDSLPRGATQARQFDRSPMAALLAASPEAGRLLARNVLGPVLDLPADEQQLLLSTLSAWFDEGGSTSATAERLFLHRNTIRYRLNRLESLTGRSLQRPSEASELHAALVALRVLPAATS